MERAATLEINGLLLVVVLIIVAVWLTHDQQLHANGLAVSFPEDERVSTVAVPFRLANLQTVPPRLPPSIGQHTDEVLAELGYDAERTAALRAAGTVA